MRKVFVVAFPFLFFCGRRSGETCDDGGNRWSGVIPFPRKLILFIFGRTTRNNAAHTPNSMVDEVLGVTKKETTVLWYLAHGYV